MATPGSPNNTPLTEAVLALVLQVPDSTEPVGEHPADRAHAIARSAARTACVVSGSLSLPPGFLGWLTIVPELVSVWKLQAQMVSDIAFAQQHLVAPMRDRTDHIERVFIMDSVAVWADGAFLGIAIIGQAISHGRAALFAMLDGAAQHGRSISSG